MCRVSSFPRLCPTHGREQIRRRYIGNGAVSEPRENINLKPSGGFGGVRGRPSGRLSLNPLSRHDFKTVGLIASPHVLRHTAATWLVMDGVPLSEVSRLLGDSEKTVETVYGKHSPDYLRRAVTALNLGSKNKPVFQL